MSTVFVIDKDGCIVDEKIAFASYRDPEGRGKTVKPKTKEEEQRLRERSERAVQIREMRQMLEDTKQTAHGEAEQREREALIKKLLETEQAQKADTAVTVSALRERWQEIKQMRLKADENGTDIITGEELDQLTWGALSQMEETLKEAESADPAAAAKLLEEMDESLSFLEETTVLTMLRQRDRFRTLNLLWQTLGHAGWQVGLLKKGTFGEQIILETRKDRNNKALIILEAEQYPEITLMTEQCRPDVRKELETMLLSAIQDHGSPFAKGICTNPVDDPSGPLRTGRRQNGVREPEETAAEKAGHRRETT